MSILLYPCTTWTLTKRVEKKLDGNYIRILRATKKILEATSYETIAVEPLTSHLKTIKVRRTRHAGEESTSSLQRLLSGLAFMPDGLCFMAYLRPKGSRVRLGHLRVGELHHWHLYHPCIALYLAVQFKR